MKTQIIFHNNGTKLHKRIIANAITNALFADADVYAWISESRDSDDSFKIQIMEDIRPTANPNLYRFKMWAGGMYDTIPQTDFFNRFKTVDIIYDDVQGGGPLRIESVFDGFQPDANPEKENPKQPESDTSEKPLPKALQKDAIEAGLSPPLCQTDVDD